MNHCHTSFIESLLFLDPLKELSALHDLHDDEEAFVVVVRVLEDGLEVDDVLAGGRAPVEVDLATALGVVLQHLGQCYDFKNSFGEKSALC
jgi:hypothetical protein